MRRALLAACLAVASLAAARGAPVEEMGAYLSKAQDAAESNHLAEAIRSYVAVLAMAEDTPSAASSALAEEAASRLAQIGTRLSLEPSGEWLDSKGAQVAGNSRKLGKEGGLSPSVYLFENFGSGKSPVGDAPISFSFAANSGSLIATVTTDAYGKANTTVAKLDEPGESAVIRAYPVFRARGKSYAFQSVYRDFSYLPPANVVKVVALERSDLGPNGAPGSGDAVAAALKEAGLEGQILDAQLAPGDFRLAYGGDAKALGALGVGPSSPYAAFCLVEVAPARQLELNGKKYNIFTAAASINVRIVRADGSALYSLPIDGVKGQGGTGEAAVSDAYRRARGALSSQLERRIGELRDAFAKQ